ncbi:pectinacetylesterase family protein [Pleionea sp. CnH1-48]|uniref:pectinacetylesterase family protein n=1 Tax=Pleionea sp. CnH1-48 TaxID=2954494 RepID=UPI002097CFAB|nr:pectinacetylesterase family protein [Pleionea sp. CnH1-48]MCO7226409.1 pectinacetylesterase family protein [Pleionea sp. CnH1-48]
MNKKLIGAIAVSSVLGSFSISAHAELGDYGFWQTIKNLFSPPKADNPVNSTQRLPPYPLKSNPSGFDDGFSAGSYLKWQTVQLHPDTGAVCGDGSPYKIFVNRVAHTSNTVYYLEGGGACWDYESCTGQTGIRGARNPNGIPDNYMSLMNPSASLVSPFVFRLHPWTRTKSQNWNMVYIPYCTGDIYSGDKVEVYEDPQGQKEPLVWHHNGLKNLRAATAWLKNNLQRPGQLLMTGCSAGGTGTLTNYAGLREDIAPTKGYMINDSGPIFTAPRGGSDRDYPSIRLHEQIRAAWGLDNGPLAFLSSRVPGFSDNDMGTLYGGLAQKYGNDRMGHTHFWQDLNYSSYSYERFYDDINNESDPVIKEQKIHALWHKDTNNLVQNLEGHSNIGYYLPYYRGVNESHCTSIIEFANADIQEQGLELDDFVKNVMEGNGAVMQASETDKNADYNKPFNFLYWLLDQLL